jgi:uncharacterized membrane protein YidH (DUF202 family)
MNGIVDWITHQMTGNLFAASISLIFIVTKLFVRYITHLTIKHKYDFWAALVWFGVDISVFTLSLCMTSNIPNKKGFTYQGAVWWYILLLISTLLSAFCYARFLKRKKVLKDKAPIKDLRSCLWLSTAWFFGYAFFLPTVGTLAI